MEDLNIKAQRNQPMPIDAVEWITIDCLLNGALVLMQFNIAQMRQHLGLPGFPLLPTCRPPMRGLDPQHNMEDIDNREDHNYHNYEPDFEPDQDGIRHDIDEQAI